MIRHFTTACFIPEQGKIASLFCKNIKETSKKLKNIQWYRYAISEIGKLACLDDPNQNNDNDNNKRQKRECTKW